GDVGELFDGGDGDDGAVAVDEHPVGEGHEEHAGDDGDPGRGLDDLEGGPHGLRGGVRGARDHAVGESRVHHEGAEVAGVGDGVEGAVVGDAAVGAEFGVFVGEADAQEVVEGADDLRGLDVEAEAYGAGA